MSSPNQSTKIVAEKEEESKLKAKYPQMQQRPGPQFLQKRLQKGQKFFDSGDYNMAKAAAAKGSAGKSRLSSETKLTSQQPSQQHPLPPCPNMANPPIPTPDCLATRKSSIHVPNLQ